MLHKLSDNKYMAYFPNGRCVIEDVETQPTVTLTKWDECRLTIRPRGYTPSKVVEVMASKAPEIRGLATLEQLEFLSEIPERLEVQNGSQEIRLYQLPPAPQYEDGGLEIELVLHERPQSNVFEFDIETEGLVFYYQPPLTKIETGAHQPENVVGSYAVYHATRGNLHASAEEAARYKTGKAYHIFRPLVKDAAGNETWGDLHVDTDAGILSVTVDQEWLDRAVYPVVVDPTLGYTAKGAQYMTVSASRFNGISASYPESSSGQIVSFSVCVAEYSRDSSSIRVGVYEGNDYLTRGPVITQSDGVDWVTVEPETPAQVTPDNVYNLVAICAAGNNVDVYRDRGSEGIRSATGPSIDKWPSSVSFNSSSYNWSIYLTYELDDTGETHYGEATLSADSALQIAGSRQRTGAQAISATTAFGAQATRERQGSAHAAAVAGFDLDAGRIRTAEWIGAALFNMTAAGSVKPPIYGEAVLVALSGWQAQAIRRRGGGQALTAATTMEAKPTRTRQSASYSEAMSMLTAVGLRSRASSWIAAASTDYQAVATRRRASAATFAAESDFWIELEDVVKGVLKLFATSAMAAEASKVARGRLTLPAQTSISAAGGRIRGGRWHGESATALDLAASKIAFGGIDWQALTDYQAVATRRRASAATFAAESDFWIELEDVVKGVLKLFATSAMAAEASKVARGRLTLPAQTSISAAGGRIRGGRWHGESATALDLAASKIAFGGIDWQALTEWEIITGHLVLGILRLSAESELYADPVRLRGGRLDFEGVSKWLGQAIVRRGGSLCLAAETDFEAIAQRMRYSAAHYHAVTDWLLKTLPPLIRETHLLGRQDWITLLVGTQELTTRLPGRRDWISRLVGLQELTTRLLGRADLITRLVGGVQMAATGQDFKMISGDTHKLVFTVALEGKDATLQGVTLRWGMGSGSKRVVKTTSNGITITGPNTCEVLLRPEDTEALSGAYRHELEMVDQDGNVVTLAMGGVIITQDLLE